MVTLNGCKDTYNKVTVEETGGSVFISNHYNQMMSDFEDKTRFDDYNGQFIIQSGDMIRITASSKTKHVIITTEYNTNSECLNLIEMSFDDSLSDKESVLFISALNDIASGYNANYEYSHTTESNMEVYSYKFDANKNLN